MSPVRQNTKTAAPLLTAIDATSQVHLIIGTNPLAAARCTKSIAVGANPIVIAQPSSEIHYTLAKKIEEGAVKWIQRDFKDDDLKNLGRDEIDNVVDAVFVTVTGRNPLSKRWTSRTVVGSKVLTFSRHPHLIDMSKIANPSQCSRCTKSLHVHATFHTCGRTAACWNHNFWQRLQTCVTNTSRDSILTSSRPGKCDREIGDPQEANTGGGSYLGPFPRYNSRNRRRRCCCPKAHV